MLIYEYPLLFIVVAFLVALNQNKELLGKNGLLPIPQYLNTLRRYFEVRMIIRKPYSNFIIMCIPNLQVPSNFTTTLKAFNAAPSLLWWVAEEDMDFALDMVAYVGLVLSGTLVFLGAGNAVIFLCLWVLYHSLVNVGQRW